MVELEQTFAEALPELVVPWSAAVSLAPEIVVQNDALATELGVAIDVTDAPQGVAMAYAGHQFGTYSPRLGDGRALLVEEVVDTHGDRRDIHLKGSGRTPFARGGDGKAALGPMLREYLISEAMHALGIPTTRSLAVVATGEQVVREEGALPGAVLTRVAASHIRVGTFEYAAAHEDPTLVQRLADYAIARHYPDVTKAEEPYLAFFAAVVEKQASLIAQWMLVGFVHGVMNTDNMAISGETIDYGPCAFIDAFDPQTVFSSIDHAGRYAFGNQPRVAQWNLARLAETLVPLVHKDLQQGVAMVTAVLDSFAPRFQQHWLPAMETKLGVSGEAAVRETLDELRTEQRDYTAFCRSRGEHNPIYIPRNHLVEDALSAATAGDLMPFDELLEVVRDPFTERPGFERYAEPAPAGDSYVTYCGT